MQASKQQRNCEDTKATMKGQFRGPEEKLDRRISKLNGEMETRMQTLQ